MESNESSNELPDTIIEDSKQILQEKDLAPIKLSSQRADVSKKTIKDTSNRSAKKRRMSI